MIPTRRTLTGVAFICFANVLLEIALTRLFSAMLYYHFTFVAIAVALLGMGASGVYVYVRADRFRPASVLDDLALYAQLFAITTTLALLYLLNNPSTLIIDTSADPRITSGSLVQLLLLLFVSMLPFFCAGVVVALAVTHFRGQISRIYFYDLLGAGMAALFAGLLLGLMGGPALLLSVAVIASAGGALFAPRSRLRALALVGAFVALLGVAVTTSLVAIPSAKGVERGRLLWEGWNTFSRITVERLRDGTLDVKIDACASTAITPASESRRSRWQRQVTALGYSVAPAGADSVLIIGPGGGRDVAHALASGAHRVVGVEVNPLIAHQIMRARFADASERLYFDPRVNIVVDEGRSFIRRSRDRYDVIQASLVDTWAATSAGAFALTENALYTLEAVDDYLGHLTPSGVLTMSRFHTKGDPETMRLVLLAAGALEHRGVRPGLTRRHLILATKGAVGTLLAKRSPFSAEELARVAGACQRGGFDLVLGPTTDGSSELERLVDAGAWSAPVRALDQNLLPPSDDKPFFFFFAKPHDFLDIGRQVAALRLRKPAAFLLMAIGMILGVLTVLFVFLPLTLAARPVHAARASACRNMALAFFASMGLAFMVVEVGLMQRLSLFLGHPSYALVVVLFSILVGAALGARLSEQVPDARCGSALLKSALAVSVLALAAAFGLPSLLHALVALPLPVRVLWAGAVVGAFGLLMGVLLPFGVRLVAQRTPGILPWAWGLNGSMSVAGTVAATVIAILWGFTTTLCVGAALYVVAGAAGAALGIRTGSRLMPIEGVKTRRRADERPPEPSPFPPPSVCR